MRDVRERGCAAPALPEECGEHCPVTLRGKSGHYSVIPTPPLTLPKAFSQFTR